MKKRILNNLIFSLIAFSAIIVVNFALPRLMPGNPVANLIGVDTGSVTREEYDAILQETGLYKPVIEQFADYLKGIITGDLGYSFHRGERVDTLILQRMPSTLQIALPAWIISALLAIILGVNAGYKRGKRLDYFLSGTMTIVDTVPSFLTAIILLILFSFKWNLLPSGGLSSIDAPSGIPAISDRLKHLILPVSTLVTAYTPKQYLIMRNLTASATDERYIIYARAKGLSPTRIKFLHIFPNVSGAFLSMLGTSFGKTVAGSIAVETVFSVDGIGLLTSRAISDLDYPVLQGVFLTVSVFVLVSNFLSDLACAFIDPRQRRSKA